jgi:hypothetical protein
MHSTVDSVFSISPLPSEFPPFSFKRCKRSGILDSKQSQPTRKDRVWRRWITFCAEAGLDSDPFLSKLQQHETELVMRAFCPSTEWLNGARQEPFLASVRARGFVNCARCRRQLGCVVSGRFERSPVHLEGSTQLLPTSSLLRAFDNTDPPPERQKAITPKFLRRFFTFLSPTRKETRT